jgi:hypothetical protein
MSAQRHVDEEMQTLWKGQMKVPEQWRRCREVQGEYVKKCYYFLKSCDK